MNNLVRFIKRFHFVILFLLLEGFALILLVNNQEYQAGQMRRFFNEMTGSIFGEVNLLTDYFYLRKTNEELSRENAYLRSQIAQSYQLSDRKFYVKNDTTYSLNYEYIQARIISNSITKRNNNLMINKGQNHGIEEGMAVISPNGIVGIVNVVSRNYSSVLSLLHSDSRIPAKIKRDNSSGSILWNGKSYRIAQMTDVPSHTKINIGDTVITSGYSLAFPEGISIGTIRKIQTRQGDNFHTLDMQLNTNFNTLDHVYIVKNLHKNELRNIEQQNQIGDEQ